MGTCSERYAAVEGLPANGHVWTTDENTGSCQPAGMHSTIRVLRFVHTGYVALCVALHAVSCAALCGTAYGVNRPLDDVSAHAHFDQEFTVRSSFMLSITCHVLTAFVNEWRKLTD